MHPLPARRCATGVETTWSRIWLFGAVLPRAISSSRAAGRRTEESGIPAWTSASASSARPPPTSCSSRSARSTARCPNLETVHASVDACARPRRSSQARGVADAHREPPPLGCCSGCAGDGSAGSPTSTSSSSAARTLPAVAGRRRARRAGGRARPGAPAPRASRGRGWCGPRRRAGPARRPVRVPRARTCTRSSASTSPSRCCPSTARAATSARPGRASTCSATSPR